MGSLNDIAEVNTHGVAEVVSFISSIASVAGPIGSAGSRANGRQVQTWGSSWSLSDCAMTPDGLDVVGGPPNGYNASGFGRITSRHRGVCT